MAKKASSSEGIQRPVFRTEIYHVRGTSPLDCNQMSPETRAMLERKAVGEKEGGVKPAVKTREQQFEDCLYRLPEFSPWRTHGWIYGFPGRGVKKALIEAARLTERDMVHVKQTVRVRADYVPIIYGQPELCFEIINKFGSGSTASLRARFVEWEMLIPTMFLEGAKGLTADEVRSLFAIAGRTVGFGCSRLINGGDNGEFDVVKVFTITGLRDSTQPVEFQKLRISRSDDGEVILTVPGQENSLVLTETLMGEV
jgi:hypothetical protein